MPDNPPTHDDAESEAESIQSAMNMARACLFGDSANLSGAIKDEPTRLLIADKLNRLDLAIENGLNTAMRSGQRALSQERQLREEAERERDELVKAIVEHIDALTDASKLEWGDDFDAAIDAARDKLASVSLLDSTPS